MLLSSLLFAVLKLSVIDAAITIHHRIPRQVSRPTEPRACKTPNNEIGTCVDTKNCALIVNILKNKNSVNNVTITNYVRKSQCGFRNGSPQVCCPVATTRLGGLPEPECGLTVKTTNIVGGKPAPLGAYPWMAGLGYRIGNRPGPEIRCGGSLISSRWVITAAHCLANLPSNMRLTSVRLGDLDLTPGAEDGATPIDVPVEEAIIHSGYTSSPVTNDIGLLRLRNPVQFTTNIRPLCLLSNATYKEDTYYRGKLAQIVGWGAVRWQGPSSPLLQVAKIKFVPTTDCASAYSKNSNPSIIDQRVMCAGDPGIDTCQGDSGGPLMFAPDGERFYLGGIVSFGYKCADPNYPGVYTRVASFIDWINEKTGLKFYTDH